MNETETAGREGILVADCPNCGRQIVLPVAKIRPGRVKCPGAFYGLCEASIAVSELRAIGEIIYNEAPPKQ